MLISLKNELSDINKTRSNIIQIEDFLSKKTTKLSPKQEEKLNEIIIALSDHATLSAKGANSYDVAKQEILSFLPLPLQQEANKHFTNFEHAEQLANSGMDSKSIRAAALEALYTTIGANAVDPNNIGANQIGSDDFKAVVEPNICKIAKEHSIIAGYCSESIKSDSSVKLIPSDTIPTNSSKSSGMPRAIKVLLWIVGIVVVSFVGIIIAFAIKAKLREKYEEEE